MMVLPLLLMINIYRFVFTVDEVYTFKGLAYIHKYFSTFPGLNGTFMIIQTLQKTATSFETIRVASFLDILTAINNFFTMLGLAFSIPIMIVVDVVRDLWWFISILWGN